MKNSTLKNIGIFSTALFATASAVYMYSPVIGSHADSSASADINLNVGEVMSLTLSTDSLNLSTSPNNFVSGVVSATASTNAQYGYTLTLEDVDNNTNMVHTNENIDAVVTSDFSGKKTSTDMDNNTWGFSLNTTDFYKVPVNGSPVAIKRTTTPMTAASETTDVTFGAKVGNLTSGTYTDKVLFTMYVNGQDGKPSDGTNPGDPGAVSSMQEFRCSDLMNVGDSATLKDTRDGNTYTVKKLKDNKCWMTDNLRIIDTTISSADSNLPEGESWTIPASDLSSFSTAYNTDAVYYNSTYGGYYNFYTTTAGWGTDSTTREDSPKSICPKGWRLPTGDPSGEYAALYDKYHSFALMLDEPAFTTGGFITNGTFYGLDIIGGYWPSSSNTANYAYSLYLDGSNGYPSHDINKRYGFNVRCVAE